MQIRGLGYLGLAVRDPAPWRDFATEVLGLMPAAGTDPGGVLRFRMDAWSWRLAVHPADRDGLAYLGWQLDGDAELAAAIAHLEREGVALESPSEALRAERGVGGLARFRDPWGHVHELFCTPTLDDGPFVSPAGVSGFLTDELGMGHALLTTPDHTEAAEFYSRVLGLRMTDCLAMGEGKAGVFMRANARHHSLAFTDLFPEPALHHFMIEARSMEDVGRAWDRVQDRDVPIKMSLGQHSNDPVLSFYVETPSGFDVEFGWKALLVDDAAWKTRELSGSGEIWGHRGGAMEEITQARPDSLGDGG